MPATLQTLSEEDSIELASLPAKQRDRVLAWMDALAPAAESSRLGRGALVAAAARRMGAPLKTASRLFYAWMASGWHWTALADHRALPAASRPAAGGPDDPKAFAEWVRGIAENYGANTRRAHAAIVAFWKAGNPIPGYALPPPASASGLPAGWSYASLCRLCRLSRHERLVASVGRSAARGHASMVLRSRVGLVPGQIYQFDDVWHDVQCFVPGQKEPVRPLELCCLDLASAHKIAWGIKPRIRDEETGRRVNLRDRDMRFLLAHVLCCTGYSPDGVQLMTEHGTAAISAEVAAIIERFGGGRIACVSGGIQDAPAVLGAWSGHDKGNPQFKAAIESSHRIIHNYARWLPGQTGGNSRETMPEELVGRTKEFQALCKELAPALQTLSPQEAEWMLAQLKLPFVPFDAYARIVGELYDIIGAATDHHLEGWKDSGYLLHSFRTRFSDTPVPLSVLDAATPGERALVHASIRANPALLVSRPMSRAEVWRTARLTRLPPAAFAEIAGIQNATERTVRDHAIRFVEGGRQYSYPAIAVDSLGRNVLLADGEKYACIGDPYDAGALYVLDAKGRYVGRLSHQIVASQADMESLHRAMGEAARLEAIALAPYRFRHADRAGAVKSARTHNAGVLSLQSSPFRQPSAPVPAPVAAATLADLSAAPDPAELPAASSTGLDDIFPEEPL
jgi:hypothetical protein